MAKILDVQRGPQIVPPITSIKLELTGEEAETLCSILMRVGGVPSTRRQHATRILNLLSELGFHLQSKGDNDGTIRFF